MLVLDDSDVLHYIITISAEVRYVHPLTFTQTVTH